MKKKKVALKNMRIEDGFESNSNGLEALVEINSPTGKATRHEARKAIEALEDKRLLRDLTEDPDEYFYRLTKN